jgi:hypothetical protein
MTRFRIESALVVAFGFAVGALLSTSLAPGYTLLWMTLGLASAIFFHEFFVRELGGELFWPAGGRRNPLLAPFRLRGRSSRLLARLAGHATVPSRHKGMHFRKSHRHND